MAIPVNAYEQLAGQMLKIYEEAELIMIGRVAKRLAKGVSSPGWTERKLCVSVRIFGWFPAAHRI